MWQMSDAGLWAVCGLQSPRRGRNCDLVAGLSRPPTQSPLNTGSNKVCQDEITNGRLAIPDVKGIQLEPELRVFQSL